MKTKILMVCLFACALSLEAQTNTNCNLVVWTPSPAATGDPGELYKFYHSTNINDPFTNWTLIAWCPTTVTNAPIAVLPGVHYFFMTFSNWWGESVPSNVASTPAAPLPPTLRIERINSP